MQTGSGSVTEVRVLFTASEDTAVPQLKAGLNKVFSRFVRPFKPGSVRIKFVGISHSQWGSDAAWTQLMGLLESMPSATRQHFGFEADHLLVQPMHEFDIELIHNERRQAREPDGSFARTWSEQVIDEVEPQAILACMSGVDESVLRVMTIAHPWIGDDEDIITVNRNSTPAVQVQHNTSTTQERRVQPCKPGFCKCSTFGACGSI